MSKRKDRHMQCNCKTVQAGRDFSVSSECICSTKMFGRKTKFKTVITDSSGHAVI